jgi:Squalene-hopene cyclase C-terminal domain
MRLPVAAFLLISMNQAATQAATLPEVFSKSGPIRDERIALPAVGPNSQYSVLYSVPSLRAFSENARVTVEARQGSDVFASKTLHAGDPDFYFLFRPARSGPAAIVVRAQDIQGQYRLQVNRWPRSAQIKAGPNQRWQDAQEIPLGATIFASGDDQAYIPLPTTPRRAAAEPSGDWYRFDFTGSHPQLVFFQIDLMERDQLPVDVSIFRIENGQPREFTAGEDPVALPHEVQALPGNKFAPRILSARGTYYIRVRANHPEYKLRTRVYDPPPYNDPHEAVRVALDYILGAGDSWHANTPRRGGILDRVASVHQETSLCVGCHATHFPLRAQLYAARNGYPVVQKQALQFLIERFYNNPRPFYGFEDASWARMISAPANVLGRMSHLTDIFESEVSGEPRPKYHQGIARYLDLYYAGRTALPPDETNGNTPLVSAHEVSWYAWTATKDPRLPEMIAAGEIKNMVDLCYQTLALADMDRAKYAAQIHRNADRILSLQRSDGQWSMRFEPEQPEVEFQTGHALWALQAAGVPAENSQVAKAIQYLLRRQQIFGGWMDPLQSFENFRTPFRETQMAILALSAYFPAAKRAHGWNSPAIDRLSDDPVEQLAQLDQIWDAPSSAVRKQIDAAARSNDALIRQAAVEALGRLGDRDPVFATSLGDPSKMVQRTAAWAMRQTYSRRAATPSSDLEAAMNSADDRTRWGAARVFAQHFSAIARRPDFVTALGRLAGDPVTTVRMAAVKGLWQFWFWSPDQNVRGKIEDTLLTAIAQPQSSWVASNLRDAIYNLADENIRYLYNNWVPLLALPEDRTRAIEGRLAIESRLAEKFAAALDRGSNEQRIALLRALTEFPLRRADVYDLDADLARPAPPVYNRIGNDIEQIAFFGSSAGRLAKSLLPLLDSPDAELRRLAQQASLLTRETRFADVNRVAGPAGPEVAQLTRALESKPETAEIARGMKAAPPAAPAAANTARRATVTLDESYFRAYVAPILETRGKDGYACIHCHATHTVFDATWATVKNVADPEHPEDSLILRKPTSTSETEGIAGSKTLAHGGGQRFTRDSPEYSTILKWIQGAKIPAAR